MLRLMLALKNTRGIQEDHVNENLIPKNGFSTVQEVSKPSKFSKVAVIYNELMHATGSNLNS